MDNALKSQVVIMVQRLLQLWYKGVSNGLKNFQLLAKFGLFSICSQILDECVPARARRIFGIARMLGFSLEFAWFLKTVNHVKPALFALSTQNIVNSSTSYNIRKIWLKFSGGRDVKWSQSYGTRRTLINWRVKLAGNLWSVRCSLVVFSKVLAARKTELITARARKKRRSARMLTNARKDHSIPLYNLKTVYAKWSKQQTVITVVESKEKSCIGFYNILSRHLLQNKLSYPNFSPPTYTLKIKSQNNSFKLFSQYVVQKIQTKLEID